MDVKKTEDAVVQEQSYKYFHEKFMQNHNGTTAWDTYSVFLPSFLTVFASISIISLVLPCAVPKVNNLARFLIEFFVLVIPIILSVTVLSDALIGIFIFFLGFAIALLIVLERMSTNIETTKINVSERHRHFITNARSTINLMTIICILAVDFKIFPRRFAKTETYGFSLMDVGVGLFVYSNGIVAPEIYQHRRDSYFKTLYKSIVGSIPLIILGVVRTIATSEVDYQQHVSEYGVHWNFFITLAVTKILTSIILGLINIRFAVSVAVAILTIHEFLLLMGLHDWVLSEIKRENFLTANREGIVSSLGYVGIYFLSVHIGRLMKNKVTFTSNIYLILQMLLLSIIMLSISFSAEINFRISRRLANAAYCVWVVFIGVSMTMLFLIIEMGLRYIYASTHRYFKSKKILLVEIYTPLIYEAINFNGLTFFLFSNILTGFINLSIHTLEVNSFLSFLIITLYTLLITSIIVFLYLKEMRLKFW